MRLQATDDEIQAAVDAHTSNWKPSPELQAKWDAWEASRAQYGIPDDYGHCLGARVVLLIDRETREPAAWGFWLSGLTTEEMDLLRQYGKVTALKTRTPEGKSWARWALITERVKDGVVVRTRVIKKVRLKDLKRWT